MYQFPPTAWQAHGLAFSDTTLFWLVAVFVFLVVLFVKRSGSARLCGFWAFVGTVQVVLVLARYGKSPSLFSPPYPIDDVLRLSLLFICAVGLVTALRANSKKAEHGGFAAMAGTGLATVSFVIPVLLPPTVSHWPATVRTQCKNNLKQIGIAFHNYHDAYQLLPPAKISKPDKSWRVNLLPFLDLQRQYEMYDESTAWNSKINLPLTLEPSRVFECPGRPKRHQTNEQGQFLTAYTVPVGAQSVFDGSQQVRLRDVQDGMSNTVMVVESCGTDIVWSEPRDSDLTKVEFSVNAASSQIDRSNSLLSSYHGGLAQVLLADGSVRVMNDQIDEDLLKALITKAAGDDAGDDW